MEELKPKFSIIIPNYNKGRYIEECLNSIIRQSYKNYEIIVVDDGSNDESIEKIKKFDVQLYHTNRLQAGGARNLGMKMANGEYIIFLDSDDYLTSNTVLEELNDTINNEDLIFLNYTLNKCGKFEDRYDLEGDISQKIEKTTFLGAPTKCYKKILIEDLSFPECQRYEDIAITIEVMCKAEKYTTLRTPFFTYRKVVGSNSTAKIDASAILAVISELVKLYKLCIQYPKYKSNILNRIKNDRIGSRLNIIDYMFENDIDDMELSQFFDMLNNHKVK